MNDEITREQDETTLERADLTRFPRSSMRSIPVRRGGSMER